MHNERERGAAIAEAARAYLGVRFVHAGRTRYGLDCVGLLIVVGHDLALLPREYDLTDYNHEAVNPARMLAEIERFCTRIESWHDWQPGDIALLKVRGAAQHVGILTEICPPTGKILHACTSLKCVAEQALDPFLWANIAGVFRFDQRLTEEA